MVCGTEEARAGSAFASGAGGRHRRAGAAVRLLLQWNDHQGLGTAFQVTSTYRLADTIRHERPPLQMWDIPPCIKGH